MTAQVVAIEIREPDVDDFIYNVCFGPEKAAMALDSGSFG